MEDPPLSMLHTKYDRDIYLHEIVPASPVVIDWIQKWNMPYIHTSRLDTIKVLGNLPSAEPRVPDQSPSVPKEPAKEAETIDPRYLFQTPFPSSKQKNQHLSSRKNKLKKPFRP
jgi:hypothetical protein